MTAPRFRSTAALTMRRGRVASAIERDTYVLFSLGGQRFAASAHSVQRVLRYDESIGAHPDDHLQRLGRAVATIDLRHALCPANDSAATSGCALAPDTSSTARGARTLVFADQGMWVATIVDAVYEVVTIDTALVLPASSPIEVASGQFSRHDQLVLVLDMPRVVRALYDATADAADVGSSDAASTSQ